VNEANDTKGATERRGPEPLSVGWQQDGDTHSVVPCGELDVASAPVLEAELRRIESLAPSSVRLDLSRLTFMDSTGVRLLVAAHERATQRPYSISFLRGPPIIQRVIEMTGLQSVLFFAD
jgi:anti-sigma B factor antagonist